MRRDWLVGLALASSLAVAGSARAADPASPPTLAGIGIVLPPGAGGSLQPAFAPETTEYTLDVAGDVTGLALVPALPAGSSAKVTVNGNKAKPGAPVVVAPAVGESRVEIAVSGQEGAKTTYAVTVRREDLAPLLAGFQRFTYTDPISGITMGYRLFVPEDYTPSKSYPLVVFLHGAGQTGSDNEAQLTVSQGAAVWARPEEQAKRSCLVLAPQAPAAPSGRSGWTRVMAVGPGRSGQFEPQAQLTAAYGVLRKVMLEYTVDPKRVYLTGISMGGYGAFAMAIEHPETFAAVVPIAGGGDPDKLKAVAQLPMWIFHAEEDPVIPAKLSRESVKALRAAGGSPRYTEVPRGTFLHPDAHGVWGAAYGNPELREWVFAQAR